MIIYQGPSLIDGSPIVAITVSQSGNTKTGNMVQTYIIRADINPLEASKTGADYAICGACRIAALPTLTRSVSKLRLAPVMSTSAKARSSSGRHLCAASTSPQLDTHLSPQSDAVEW